MLRFALILAATSSLLYRADAFTPTADQKLCAELPANADVVAACTRIIEATNSSTLDRAVSHTFRADAARADGNTAAAIADYNQALALMPTLVTDTAWPAFILAEFSRGRSRRISQFNRPPRSS